MCAMLLASLGGHLRQSQCVWECVHASKHCGTGKQSVLHRCIEHVFFFLDKLPKASHASQVSAASRSHALKLICCTTVLKVLSWLLVSRWRSGVGPHRQDGAGELRLHHRNGARHSHGRLRAPANTLSAAR